LHQIRKKRRSAQKTAVLGVLFVGTLVACEPQDEIQAATAAEPPASGCGEAGSVEAALFGSIETDIRWSADQMQCESMLRPDGEGLRVRFAGTVSGETLAIIIAMPELRPDEVGREIPSNVTATVEGSGRFFSTPNLDSCWTEVNAQTPLHGPANARAISGTLFCIAPLGEINGDAAISIPKLTFATIVNWSAS
jgi:hypothetical protein